jgi:hypothetical protein
LKCYLGNEPPDNAITTPLYQRSVEPETSLLEPLPAVFLHLIELERPLIARENRLSVGLFRRLPLLIRRLLLHHLLVQPRSHLIPLHLRPFGARQVLPLEPETPFDRSTPPTDRHTFGPMTVRIGRRRPRSSAARPSSSGRGRSGRTRAGPPGVGSTSGSSSPLARASSAPADNPSH